MIFLALLFAEALASAPSQSAAHPVAHGPALREPAHAAKPCALGPSERAANRTLSFTEFDQQGAVASSARALASRGCFAEAVKANLDYLITGPELSDYERNVIRFHTGQYLAQIGEEKAAAAIIAGTRRGVDPARPAFDWDGYVAGVYAFLIKDRALLDAMTARLARQANPGNDTNGKVLRRFQLCFDQPFRIAYGVDPRCDPQAERGGVSPAEGR